MKTLNEIINDIAEQALKEMAAYVSHWSVFDKDWERIDESEYLCLVHFNTDVSGAKLFTGKFIYSGDDRLNVAQVKRQIAEYIQSPDALTNQNITLNARRCCTKEVSE